MSQNTFAALGVSALLVGTVYGMNFDHMPERHWVDGYPLALVLMVLGSIVLYYLFKRRGWL